jgi:CBS domain containing-hemolysin-like protein
MSLLVVYALAAIFFSFLCSILEAVLLSITPTFINIKKNEGHEFANELEVLKKDVDKPLIAILTINTIAHTVGAILVGVQAKVAYAEMYGTSKTNLFGIAITEDLMVGIVSTIMTILILVASEIIPKTIGATYWRELARFTATTLNLLIFPLKYSGILWLLQLTTRLIGGEEHNSILSRESFLVMADMAEKEGVFHQNESKVIRNLIGFKEIKVTDVMTPISVLELADENDTIASFYKEHSNLRFSRIPLFNENPDEITGYFLKSSLLEAIISGKGDETLTTLKREILITERDLSIPDLFDILIKEKEHIALVVDEYGSVNGIVSQEDVIETLLGLEIMDETDNVADLQELARKSWKDRAKKITFKKKNQ